MPRPGWFAALLLVAALAGGSQARAEAVAVPAEPYAQAELDQLLAHVALYPDELLSHVLIAVTYPLEVVDAARWTRRNPGLTGDAAVAAAAEQGWAPAVTALVAFPEILQRMDEDLDWTQRLGDAVLVQETQVMDTVQALRQRAWAAGNLTRLEHVNVRREREVIHIEPVRREIVHVPYYNPVYVYGPWWHPAHPPWFWTPVYWGPGFHAPARFHSGGSFWWGSGITVSSGFLFSRPDWYRRHLVVVKVPVYPPRHRGPARVTYRGYQGWSGPGHRWRHDPGHRRGVAYSRPLPPRHVAPGHSPRVVAPARPPRRPAQDGSAWQRDGRGSAVEAQRREDPRTGGQRRDGAPGSGQQRGETAMTAPRQPAAGSRTPPVGTGTEDQRLRIEQRLRADGWQRPDGRPREAAAPLVGSELPRPGRSRASLPAPALSRDRVAPPGRQPAAAAPVPRSDPAPRAVPAARESRGEPAPSASRAGRGGDSSSHQAAPEAAPGRGADRPARVPNRGSNRDEGAPGQGRGGVRR